MTEDQRAVDHCVVEVYIRKTPVTSDTKVFDKVLAYYKDAGLFTLFIKYYDGEKYIITSYDTREIAGWKQKFALGINSSTSIQQFLDA